MRATAWEFRNRAMMFGCLLSLGFGCYVIDKQNVVAALANGIEHRFGGNADAIARGLFFGAALLIALAALLRTWASSYLRANVVYASEVKTAALVADGPYRFVRNPLYLANVGLAIGIGTMMSRLGLVFTVVSMVVFCYRLIFREEGGLQAAQSGPYAAYVRVVPRLWPSLRARVSSTDQKPDWKAGFKAESWYWSFALGLAAFAFTLELKWFFLAVVGAIGLLAATSAALTRKTEPRALR